jgi:molybdenum cofactor cytidylyltransferase
MSTIVGIVLAAGSSQRMGRPKQLLPLDGRPLLQHVVDAMAASLLDDIVVVLGHEADAIRAAITVPAHARVVVNPRYAEGQSTSLACGLAAASAEAEAAAVLLGDQPGVDAALIDGMVRAYRSAGAPVVRPIWRDGHGEPYPGHPVVLARRIWREVAALAGDGGARSLFAGHPEWVREIPMTGEPPRDVDDPTDYQRMTSGG